MKPSDFSVLLTRYLSQYLPVQRNLSSNTIKSYRDTFKLLLTFCRDEKNMNIAKLSLKQLDKKCIEDFLIWLRQSRGASPSTYNQRLSAIHAFFDYVMTEEPAYIEQCQKIIKIKSMDTPEKPASYLTVQNLGALLAEPDISTRQGRRHLTILSVLYDTAARVSELTSVKIRDIRLDAPASITLHGKNDKFRTVPLMKQTVSLLVDYFAENHINPRIHGDLPLFFNTRRKKLTRSGITYIVQKYAGAANETLPDMPPKITPHILRHTKAMHLVQANVHPIYIRDYLGHADVTTTEVYARADNEVKREALEKASERLQLPQTSDWEHDAGLIEWLSSLG
jgi:site-specific recombinase XerD